MVQAEWVEQCVKQGKRLEGGDKGGWEIKYVLTLLWHVFKLIRRVNNDGLNMAGNFEMPSIDIEPIGSAPALSFDLNAGTAPGGEVDEEPWVYQRAGRSNLLDDDDIWALPNADPPAIASSSNTSGVFCRDQVLPLTFHVLNSQEHRSTVQTITVSYNLDFRADE